jgi:hypothetical protein
MREPNWQLLSSKAASNGDVAVVQLNGLDDKYVALVDKKHAHAVRNHSWYVDSMHGRRHARRRVYIATESGRRLHRQTLEKFVQALSGKLHNGDIAFRNNETLDCTEANLVLIDDTEKLSLADRELF